MISAVPGWVWGTLAFVVGACVGSFVNVVAYRMPREISVITPRSFCADCNRPIPWWANIPIFAYLGLRGRCVMCGARIPFRHFMAELALAVTALYLYLSFPPADAAARFVLCAALFTVALIDYDWRLIPNLITMPGILVGLALASVAMPEIGFKSSLIGLAVGWGFVFVTGEAYYLLRGSEGVGMGDVWLVGMTGAFLGWPGALFTIFVGSILGSIGGIAFAISGGAPEPPVAGQAAGAGEAESSILRTAVPFGPFLALAAGIFTLFQPGLTRWYLGG
jgi:leader peptidase (prepilin peptidase) / N-methyltransferase